MNGPDFIVAGGHKCATTTLHAALSGIPGVSMAEPKEPHYFARASLKDRVHRGIWTPEEYEELWRWTSRAGDLRGEASPLYLYFAKEVAAAIRREMVQVPKMLIVIRNPVERAFSSFQDVRLKNPAETALSFDEAVNREFSRGPSRLDGRGSPTMRHLALSVYSTGIKTFMEMLGPECVFTIDFDEIGSAPTSAWNSILGFLGLEERLTDFTLGVENRGRRAWRSSSVEILGRWSIATHARRSLARFAPAAHRRLRAFALRRLTVPGGQMSPETRYILLQHFESEIVQLEDILGWDLSHWRAI